MLNVILALQDRLSIHDLKTHSVFDDEFLIGSISILQPQTVRECVLVVMATSKNCQDQKSEMENGIQ